MSNRHERQMPPQVGCPGPREPVVVADAGKHWWRVWYEKEISGRIHSQRVDEAAAGETEELTEGESWHAK